MAKYWFVYKGAPKLFTFTKEKKTVILTKVFHASKIVGAVLESKAQVASFCLELAKKLGMRYKCPPLPVDLSICSDNRTTTRDGSQSTTQDINRSTTQDGNMNVVSNIDNNQSLVDEVAAMFAIAP